ncbi:unnamed protein product [Polarella glacialis]|uniref:EF-hand domain-containing protein n=1 Tax=Polarella glacialis TaxID=89957 RepID=A0A813JU59_POLGL|nr:unnamed protein product [Polarella glacialis]
MASHHIPGVIAENPVYSWTDDTKAPSKAQDELLAVQNKSKLMNSGVKEATKGSTFAYTDPESIKQKVRDNLLRPSPYNVFDFYHEKGMWRTLAMNSMFENTTLGVIILNALYISIDTDYNDSETLMEAHPAFQFMEHAFCAYFSFEWIVRFMAFKHKKNCVKDGWFVFDSILVAMMVTETWIMTIVSLITGSSGNMGPSAVLRLFRLLRLSRLMRMLRSLPELMILVKGMVTAMKSVMYVLGLLIIITYVFAIALTQLTQGLVVHDLYFENVLISMYSLLIYATFLDNLADFCDAIREESLPCLFIVFIFVGLAAMTVMNMLIGVLCEVVSSVAETENEERLTTTVIAKMQTVLKSLDEDNNDTISLQEFGNIMGVPQAVQALEEVGIDPVGIVDFAEMFFIEEGQLVELSFKRFMEMVLDLRESNGAKVRDIMNLWKKIHPKLHETNTELESLKARTTRIEQILGTLAKEAQRLADQRERRLASESGNRKPRVIVRLSQAVARQALQLARRAASRAERVLAAAAGQAAAAAAASQPTGLRISGVEAGCSSFLDLCLESFQAAMWSRRRHPLVAEACAVLGKARARESIHRPNGKRDMGRTTSRKTRKRSRKRRSEE